MHSLAKLKVLDHRSDASIPGPDLVFVVFKFLKLLQDAVLLFRNLRHLFICGGKQEVSDLGDKEHRSLLPVSSSCPLANSLLVPVDRLEVNGLGCSEEGLVHLDLVLEERVNTSLIALVDDLRPHLLDDLVQVVLFMVGTHRILRN
jgi:hypothetical protein